MRPVDKHKTDGPAWYVAQLGSLRGEGPSVSEAQSDLSTAIVNSGEAEPDRVLIAHVWRLPVIVDKEGMICSGAAYHATVVMFARDPKWAHAVQHCIAMHNHSVWAAKPARS